MRIAVVSKEGKALMPTTPCKCRKLLLANLAEKKWSKEGIFYIQLTKSVGEELQDVALAIDPGSKFDGYCVSGTKEVCIMGMAILPKNVKKRMETRSNLRKARRGRNCRRREARFNNRKKKEGWIAPSQLAKVQLRIRLMERLCKIFPITDIVIEDVRFNHHKKRRGKYFSTVEIGKTKVYNRAKELSKLWLINGWETAETRKEYGIKKCSQKNKLSVESHANDSLAMVCWLNGEKSKDNTSVFYVWRRQECSKRQLHLASCAKGGFRRRQGGTTNARFEFRKGDVIQYKEVVGYVGGWYSKTNLVSLVNGLGERVASRAISRVRQLQRNPNILVYKVPNKGEKHV